MALNLPVFYKRAGSAVVFVIIMLSGLFWEPLAFLILALIIQSACMYEYNKLMWKIFPKSYQPLWMQVLFQIFGAAITLFAYLYFHDKQFLLSQFIDHKPWPLLLIMLPSIMILMAVLPGHNSLKGLMFSIGSLLYISLPLACLVGMRVQQITLPAGLIFMIWSNDTLAYLVGSFIGKTPFSPISPKKTWEGTVGGALLTMAGAGIYGHYSHTYKMTDWVMLGLCATVAGTMGDLLESKLKRMADVKDSGAIMPGHGGALDRFDSLLVATPFAFAYVQLFCA